MLVVVHVITGLGDGGAEAALSRSLRGRHLDRVAVAHGVSINPRVSRQRFERGI